LRRGEEGVGKGGILNEEGMDLMSLGESIDCSNDAFLHDRGTKVENVSKFFI
jgi:hypothetical protein